MRTHRTAGCLLLALTAALAGCGGSGTTPTTSGDAPGGPLVVYSDLPLDSPAALDMSSMELGEQLALDQAGHRAGGFRVTLESNNDTGNAGTWSPGATAQAATAASADSDVVAYIGDFDSGATATSLPMTNDAGILQVSPWSPYLGLTDQNPVDDRGDPVRFYPSGHNTFARLVPSDAAQAQGMVTYMRSLGVSRLYVLEDVSDPFDADVAELIANDAPPCDHGRRTAVARHRDQHRAAGLRADRRGDRGGARRRRRPGRAARSRRAGAVDRAPHAAPARQALRAEHARHAGVPGRP